MNSIRAPVVVGVDGSSQSLEAVDVAAAEALLRHRALQIVHATVWAELAAGGGTGATAGSAAVFQARAEAIVEEARLRAVKSSPDLVVTAEVVHGSPATVLIERSVPAKLTVVGDRGLGGFTGLLAGSVAVQLATHGGGPVLTVRGQRRRCGPVVAGVDRCPAARRLLEFAAEEAALRDTDLVLVHAWRTPQVSPPGAMMPVIYDVGLLEAGESMLLTDAVAAVASRYPGLTIRSDLLRGAAGRLLVDWSRRAQLIAVGSRGRGGFAGLVLGSVSHHLMCHAECPVVVVR